MKKKNLKKKKKKNDSAFLNSAKILSITYDNENTASFQPNGINHSYFPLADTNAVLFISSSRNGICQ